MSRQLFGSRTAFSHAIANSLSNNEDGNNVRTAIQTSFSKIHDTCQTAESDNEEEGLPLTKTVYLLPPGMVALNSAFNDCMFCEATK